MAVLRNEICKIFLFCLFNSILVVTLAVLQFEMTAFPSVLCSVTFPPDSMSSVIKPRLRFRIRLPDVTSQR